MATHLNIQRGRLYPQPEYEVSVDKEGKWTANQPFLCHRDSAVSLLPRPGTPHPDVSFLIVTTATIKFQEGDLAEINCQYAGAEATYPGKDEKANATYSMGLSLTEEPLLTHIRYKDLADTERDAIQNIEKGKDKDDQGNKYEDNVTSDLGLEALAKIKRGQTSYYSPRVTWKESWVRDKACSAAELNKIGKIDTPGGPVPELAGDRNWLNNGVTQTQDGKSFRLELEWLASERQGWDIDIYQDHP